MIHSSHVTDMVEVADHVVNSGIDTVLFDKAIVDIDHNDASIESHPGQDIVRNVSGMVSDISC